MLAVAKRSIQTYFLMDSSNKIMPKEFINNKVTGIFFENKADYATWFGANPEFIHGIQYVFDEYLFICADHVHLYDFGVQNVTLYSDN